MFKAKVGLSFGVKVGVLLVCHCVLKKVFEVCGHPGVVFSCICESGPLVMRNCVVPMIG